MSTGPWKSKQPTTERKEYTPSDPWHQLADLLEHRSAKLQTVAQLDGEISARVRTISMKLGVIPLPEPDEPEAA